MYKDVQRNIPIMNNTNMSMKRMVQNEEDERNVKHLLKVYMYLITTLQNQ